MPEDPSLILSLKLDAESFDRLDVLRRRWFPPALNLIPAHLTLFHKLGAHRLPQLTSTLTEVARRPPIALSFSGLRPLGRGLAIEVVSPELLTLRAALARAFEEDLTPQDSQGFRPHVTIQNKVTPEAARALKDELGASFEPWSGMGEGLLLWRYLDGPWVLQDQHLFSKT